MEPATHTHFHSFFSRPSIVEGVENNDTIVESREPGID
jgi:hypothetical protein